MYRIRLASGQEQVYRSIQELTAGVQRGEVNAEAEIYHQRTERWLSIQSHPHYKMAAEGGAAARPPRLKLTRPSSPAPTSSVRPTPVAQQPGQTDLEELNRLLVLLDPLPTPAQRVEPAAPPSLALVPKAPSPVPPMSSDAQPVFGTMLRLEDLEPMPKAELLPPVTETLEVIRDARVVHEEEPAPVAPAPTPVESIEEIAPADLGLPIEIQLDEIPVPEVEALSDVDLELSPDFLSGEDSILPVETSHVPLAVAPVPAPFASSYAAAEYAPSHVESHDVAAHAEPNSRRRKPMLFIAAAAVLALIVYAFMSWKSNGTEGMVTLASATAPPTGLAAAPSQPAPVEADPLPTKLTATPATAKPAPASAGRDSIESSPVLPSAPSIDLSGTGAEQVVAGPGQSHKGSGDAAALARGYAASYAALERDFNTQMDRSGLVRLFSQTQLTTTDGLAGARSALDAASTAIRQYHAREAAIERAYQDSARSIERSGASGADLRDWMTHPVLKESQEAAGEGVRLIGQIDAAFALLQSQSGRYRVEGTTIRFDDADAAARYTDLQSWITRRMEHWSGQPASSVPTTLEPLLEGIGLTRLPATR
jgi:hypothetical protein